MQKCCGSCEIRKQAAALYAICVDECVKYESYLPSLCYTTPETSSALLGEGTLTLKAFQCIPQKNNSIRCLVKCQLGPKPKDSSHNREFETADRLAIEGQ